MSAHRRIFQEIARERAAQDALYGNGDELPDGTGDDWLVALADITRSECDRAFAKGRGSFQHVFLEEVYEALAESDPVKLRAELIQAVSVGVKWIQAIDRRSGNLEPGPTEPSGRPDETECPRAHSDGEGYPCGACGADV